MKIFVLFLAALVIACGAPSAQAAVTVEGVQDRQVLADRATFRVTVDPGLQYRAELNGREVALGSWIEISQPDFYLLQVEPAPEETKASETRQVRFIVKASERGDTEWGLPPWTPLPTVPSAPDEFVGGELRLIVPRQLPSGAELPAAALVTGPDGRRWPVNGTVTAAGFPGLVLRRGVGSAVVPISGIATNRVEFSAAIGGLTARREIEIEGETTWIPVSGTVSGAQSWPVNSRVYVMSNLVLTADAHLTVGAGSIVRLAPGVEVRCSGVFEVRGSESEPVVFLPESWATPWGGFVLRTNSAELRMTGAILTGSGANRDWFGSNPGSGESHRHEQPLIYVANGAHAYLTNCFLIDNQGQAAHGENAFLEMTDCLVQKCITTGQFNGGRVRLTRSALLEFPADDDVFADADNDAIYFTEGTHELTDCLVGWAKDDAIDAGSGGAGEVTVTGCWMESCYHEGLAWSGTGRIARSRDTVILNCGQGIEAGWNSPDVVADHCLLTGNLVGARFGDNYDWTYDGFLRVTNSFLLFNARDIWGRNWDDWTERLSRMDLRSNYVSVADANHPSNAIWQAESGTLLAGFLPGNAENKVGVGFASRSAQWVRATDHVRVPVRLSRFAIQPVAVEFAARSGQAPLAAGRLEFAPGQTVARIELSLAGANSEDPVVVELTNPSNAQVMGGPLLIIPSPGAGGALISAGAEWSYWETSAGAPDGWTALAFDDSAWRKGQAELGYGDGDERTVMQGGPSTNRNTTAYFRRSFVVENPGAWSGLSLSLRRDDGAVVYLNGAEIFRSNMPTGAVTYATLALSSSTSETDYFTQAVDPIHLQVGTNVVAVEVHQASKTSSDLSFDFALTGTAPSRLGYYRATTGMDLLLFWADPRAQLQQAENLNGPWSTLPNAASPVTVVPRGTVFYRLKAN